MMPSTRLFLFCIIITLLTIIGIVNYLSAAQASQISQSPQTNRHKTQMIGGRWQLVQASLGIDPFPDTISLPTPHITTSPLPSRIGFRRKKRVPPAPLHFAHDALHVPRVSLNELVVSLRRAAQEETRVEASRSDNKRGRSKVGRSATGIRQRHVSTSR